MLISLSDPIWMRLYGPYGVENVSGILETLNIKWDDVLSHDLFWEKLHHQDDLYPVTYAALPWLWDTVRSRTSPHTESLLFLSHIVYCATAPWGVGCEGNDRSGKYRGLSTLADDHTETYGVDRKCLTLADMNVLKALEQWFSGNAQAMVELCLDAVLAQDNDTDAALCAGYVALAGSHDTAHLMRFWADGYDFTEIREEVSFAGHDVKVARRLAAKIMKRNMELANMLQDFADMHDPTD